MDCTLCEYRLPKTSKEIYHQAGYFSLPRISLSLIGDIFRYSLLHGFYQLGIYKCLYSMALVYYGVVLSQILLAEATTDILG